MVSVTKYPTVVSQTTGGKFVSWDNLNNIKNNTTGSWAVSSTLIQGKSESKNRPSTVTVKGFNLGLPEGAEPLKVTVTYRHRKVAGSDYSSSHPKRICNIGGPTVKLLNGSFPIPDTNGSPCTGKGVAPTNGEMVTSTKTFDVTGLSRTVLNSNDFSVVLDYPTNSNEWNGYLRLSYVRVTVEYRMSSYNVSIGKVTGGYNKEDYTIQLSISNVGGTGLNPSVTLSTPLGFSFKSSSGSGTVSTVNARTFVWNPLLSRSVGTSSINLVFGADVTYPSGSSSYSGVFSASESLLGASGSHTATITERPPSKQEELSPKVDVIPVTTDIDNTIYFTNYDEWVEMPITLNQSEIEYIRSGYSVRGEFIADPGYEATLTEWDGDELIIKLQRLSDELDVSSDQIGITSACLDSDGNIIKIKDENGVDCEAKVLFPSSGLTYPIPVEISFHLFKDLTQAPVRSRKIHIRPLEEEDLSTPFLTMLTLTDEELNRLGTGYPYIIQSYLKHTTTDTYERDWYKNNRIGVFNNVISDNVTVTETTDPETGEVTETITDTTDYDNLTVDDIFKYADYWSDTLTNVNTYENIECQFTYNNDYPLYILITGDYTEAETYNYDLGTITHTEPCITERNNYKERTDNGTYPEPITYLIANDGSTSECTIETYNVTPAIIFYDLPLSEGYGTTDTMSIRGIELVGTIEQSDELVLSAKLVSPTGETGERTVIINNEDLTIDNDTMFSIGGLGDLWGFNTNNIHDLEDWEVQLTINNILNDDTANINFGDIQLVIYQETLDKQDINIQVEGEDLSYYGAFIEDVKIPEGLETDTDFLTVDGTDTNDAYRQNIREKEIEIQMVIGECDLQTSTDMLRQLTKLLVNDKDQYNRPIPKHITFSHYPDIYFEYIMKDALDISTETSYYVVKAKLTIPAGTAYSKQSTVTNIIGYVQGLAAISPMITFKPSASTVTITESHTGQTFNIAYPGDWNSMIVELDCANRRAYLLTSEDDTRPKDISAYVDFNSDWFSLHGEYSFSGAGCVIRTVSFNERW